MGQGGRRRHVEDVSWQRVVEASTSGRLHGRCCAGRTEGRLVAWRAAHSAELVRGAGGACEPRVLRDTMLALGSAGAGGCDCAREVGNRRCAGDRRFSIKVQGAARCAAARAEARRRADTVGSHPARPVPEAVDLARSVSRAEQLAACLQVLLEERLDGKVRPGD